MSGGEGWIGVLPESDLPEGSAVRVDAEGVEVFVYRRAGALFALADRCSHQGGPLHRGRVSSIGSRLVVTCPFHGSMFQLADGRVLRGPAARPQPVYEARIRDGVVEVRPSGYPTTQ